MPLHINLQHLKRKQDMTHYSQTIGIIALTLGLLTTTVQAQEKDRQKAIQPPSKDSPKKAAQGPKQKLNQVRTQLQSIEQTLNKARDAALEKKALQKKRTAYINAQKTQMLHIAPDQAEDINRRFQLYEELVAMNSSEKDEDLDIKERQNKLKEFRQLDKSLREIYKKASSKKEVIQKRRSFQKRLIEGMKQENEDVEELLQKRKKLLAQYRQLRVQIQKLLQQRQKRQQNSKPRP